MASYTSTEVKVGAVTIVAIVLFVLGIMLGQNYRVGVKLHTLTMQFPNSGGIQDGSPVVVNGVKRGSVGTIVNNNGSVLITAILDKIDDLRSDASARITILEITGGKKIEINPGLAVNKLNPGNIIPGKTPADIQELVVLLGDVVVDAVVLLHRIDTIAAEANKIISKGNFSDNVIKTLDNASEAALTLNEWLKKNSNSLSCIVTDLKSISSGLKDAIANNEPKLSGLLTDLSATNTNINAFIAKIESTVEKANSLIAKFDSAMVQAESGETLAGKLLYDKKFAAGLDSTLNELSKLVSQINRYGVNVNLRFGTRP